MNYGMPPNPKVPLPPGAGRISSPPISFAPSCGLTRDEEVAVVIAILISLTRYPE